MFYFLSFHFFNFFPMLFSVLFSFFSKCLRIALFALRLLFAFSFELSPLPLSVSAGRNEKRSDVLTSLVLIRKDCMPGGSDELHELDWN